MSSIDQATRTVTQYCTGKSLCPCDSSLGSALTAPGSGSLAYVALDSLGGGVDSNGNNIYHKVASSYKDSNPVVSTLISSMAESTGSSSDDASQLQAILSALSNPSPQITQQVKGLLNEALTSTSLQEAQKKFSTSLQQMGAEKIDQTVKSTAEAIGVVTGTLG